MRDRRDRGLRTLVPRLLKNGVVSGRGVRVARRKERAAKRRAVTPLSQCRDVRPVRTPRSET